MAVDRLEGGLKETDRHTHTHTLGLDTASRSVKEIRAVRGAK